MTRSFAVPIRPALVVACALWLAAPGVALAQPAATHLVPGGLAPGRTTQVSVYGDKLAGPLNLWTSFPARVEFVSAETKDGKNLVAVFQVTPSRAAPVGVGGLAVANARGASDVLYVMLDELPAASDNGNNHAPRAAQEVTLPAALDGLSDGTLADYYRFTAPANRPVACEVFATRLGWDFDPLVRILDAAGNVLVQADDDPATGPDTRLVFTPPADGPYVLELRDNRFKAGGRYWLRLGDFPLLGPPRPLAAQLGAANEVAFPEWLAGKESPAARPRMTIIPLGGSAADRTHSLRVDSPPRSAAGLTSLLLTEQPVVAETALRGGDAASATTLELPAVATGELQTPGDADRFAFDAKKGQLLRFQAVTRSAGSAAIVTLRILDAAGKQLAESPVTDSDEPALAFTAPADGKYQLAVEELAGRGGDGYAYAVECSVGPRFALVLKNDKTARLKHAVSAGGALALDVQCQRFGYDGPIHLAVEAERSSWQIYNGVIPAKANEAKVYVQPPLDFEPGEVAALRIVGRGEGAGKEAEAIMLTTTQLRTARPQTPYPPAWHDGLVFVSRTASANNFYAVTSPPELLFPRLVGEAKLTLQFERLDSKFKDTPLAVLPLALPRGITASVKRNGTGTQETYDIVLKGPKDLPEGDLSLRYFAYAELSGQGRGISSGDIRLRVVTPLAVTLAPAGPLVAGQKQKLKVSVTRRGDDKQPVEVRLKSLPPGVSGPEKVALAADQTETEIELTAAADAAPTMFKDLLATATSKYAGTEISVSSAAASLEVKTP